MPVPLALLVPRLSSSEGTLDLLTFASDWLKSEAGLGYFWDSETLARANLWEVLVWPSIYLLLSSMSKFCPTLVLLFKTAGSKQLQRMRLKNNSTE